MRTGVRANIVNGANPDDPTAHLTCPSILGQVSKKIRTLSSNGSKGPDASWMHKDLQLDNARRPLRIVWQDGALPVVVCDVSTVGRNVARVFYIGIFHEQLYYTW